MPTSTGMPKSGEVWERTIPGNPPTKFNFIVIERGRGDYWSLRVFVPGKGVQLWVDAKYLHANQGMRYVGEARADVKARFNLG